MSAPNQPLYATMWSGPCQLRKLTFMTLYPLEHRVVHPLPPAPQFVGREAELDELRSLWQERTRGVIALVGLGGAGKTALAARLLEALCRPDASPRPEGLFVWSFYQEPDASHFLSEAYRYFARDDLSPPPAKGAGLLHLLGDALSNGGPHLLILDGLERVQRQEGSASGHFGQIEDPLLRGLLTRIAEGIGQTTALVTSRFPLSDLAPFVKQGYQHREVEGLSLAAALDLLRRHGVKGDDAALAQLVQTYGAHALTLDHLGGLIGQFLDGDPTRAPEAPALASPLQDRQALRLARLLDAYQTHLPPAELALLCRLCLLERSIRLEQILPLFLCTPAVNVRTARELDALLQRIAIPESFPSDFEFELGKSIYEVVIAAHQEMPIAGPENVFVRAVHQAIEDLLARLDQTIEDDVEEIIRLYSNHDMELTTAQHPLSPNDQMRLRHYVFLYNEFRSHPLYSYAEPPAILKSALKKEGWEQASAAGFADLHPADVTRRINLAKLALQQITVKHRVLCLVRTVCRLHQQKWQASGPLALFDSAGLSSVVSALVGRHLVLREADGSLSVHPAIRDYFAHVASASERGFWHQMIGEQLISLAQRPGLRLPEDQAALDLVEEAINQAQAASQHEKAWELYVHVLGGHRHLVWKLGETARGLRILSSFDPCPDRWALGWHRRALGELDVAYAQNPFPYFRADVRLLQGRLPLVQREGEPARAAIADFLMGKTAKLPPNPLGCAIPRAQILLCHGGAQQLFLASEPEEVYETIGWEDDRSRSRLYRAEAACLIGDEAFAKESLDEAARWVLHSGSIEHLCLYHLIRCRIAKSAGQLTKAKRAVDDGLHLARQSGLGLYHIELLCELAELFLRADDWSAAESAREAYRLASAPECQYLWGAAAAGHLLGGALIGMKRLEEARSTLEAAHSLRLGIGDCRACHTEALLKALSS
jgi:hypothetical protein